MIAKERGKSVATIAIRWLWQSGLTDVILTGNSNPQELGQNLRAATFSLTEHEMASLTESSELRHPYSNVFYDIFGYRKSRVTIPRSVFSRNGTVPKWWKSCKAILVLRTRFAKKHDKDGKGMFHRNRVCPGPLKTESVIREWLRTRSTFRQKATFFGFAVRQVEFRFANGRRFSVMFDFLSHADYRH